MSKTEAPEPIWQDALSLCRDLQRGSVTASDLMENVYARIGAFNPELNAIVSLMPKAEALQQAALADATPTAERGPLHGLPMAIKDVVDVAGLTTTSGFVPFANRVPKHDAKLVKRLRAAGAIIIGHTNVPEFALGSQTFNSLFGVTKNPYDLSKTPGGSSGGAAVALAAQMLPLADGSDMGGSLRNPASFCNVVGLRPSIGRMPLDKGFAWYGRQATTGPMARTVTDTALLFSVMAGPDQEDPLTLPEPGEHFLDVLGPALDPHTLTIAVSEDLGGLPVDAEVRQAIREAGAVFTGLGAKTVQCAPNLDGAMDVFQVQRAASLRVLGTFLEAAVPDWRSFAKDTAIWNISRGFELTAEEIINAELQRTAIYQRIAKFFESVDALILPAAQVLPFDHGTEWIKAIDGVVMQSYIDWMAVCCLISVTGLPTVSVPGGFSQGGLPIGVQIVGPPKGDLKLLQVAKLFEQATQHYRSAPALASAT